MKLIASLLFIAFLTPFKANSEIIVSDVPKINIDYLGVYDETSELSLGSNFWQNSLVIKNNLLMLTMSAPPILDKEGDFLKQKVKLLYNMGDLKNTIKLISLIPEDMNSEYYKELKYDSLMLSFYYRKTCKEIETDGSSSSYFDKLRVFCNLYQKKYDNAKLSLMIMREQQIKGELFYSIANAVIEKDKLIVEPEKASYLTPTILGLYRLNNQEFSLPLTSNTDIWILKNTFKNGKINFEDKLKSAEILISKGIISTEEFKEFIFKNKENSLKNEYLKKYIETINTVDATDKTKMISEALSKALKENRFKPYALLYADKIKEIEPEASNINYSYEFIASLLFAGEYEIASNWQKIAERESEVNEIAKKTAATFAPLIKIITGTGHYGSSSIALKRYYDYKIEKQQIKESKVLSDIEYFVRFYQGFGIEQDSKVWLDKAIDLSKIESQEGVSELITAVTEERISDVLVIGLKEIKNNDNTIIPFLGFLKKYDLKGELNDISVNLILERIL
ncbi:MAG: hypothetical protein BWY78_00651 [Alphaproteobacteria bacterium ADurb.Bin438]|nr:MAG: hypothetical protein BWY78_00651 [Alphaproteobacteria bacterium ADurb.Bin438]